jgi:hypothetical protein
MAWEFRQMITSNGKIREKDRDIKDILTYTTRYVCDIMITKLPNGSKAKI